VENHSATEAIALIPARKGSKGIKNKNLQRIGEWNLVQRAAVYAYSHSKIRNVIVSTNDDKIVDSILELNKFADVFDDGILIRSEKNISIHRRPDFLCEDTSLIGETLTSISSKILPHSRAPILLMQPTSPFRTLEEISEVLKLGENFVDNGEKESFSVVSVKRVSDSHPARMYERMGDSETLRPAFDFLEREMFARRQDLRPYFLRDGAYYLITPQMLESGIPVARSPKFLVRDFPWNINIDDLSDLILSRSLLSSGGFNDNVNGLIAGL
jgi:N-acylneuraminate cytidylyltransferase